MSTSSLGGSRPGWFLNRFATKARFRVSWPFTTSLKIQIKIIERYTRPKKQLEVNSAIVAEHKLCSYSGRIAFIPRTFIYTKNLTRQRYIFVQSSKPIGILCYNSSLFSARGTPVAEFIDPWLGDKMNSGIGLSYRPANHVAGLPIRQPYAGVDFNPPSQGSLNSAILLVVLAILNDL